MNTINPAENSSPYDYSIDRRNARLFTLYLVLMNVHRLSSQDAFELISLYEIEERLSDPEEKELLMEYGIANIASDMVRRQMIGQGLYVSTNSLFDVNERAISRNMYYLIRRAVEMSNNSIEECEK